MPVVEIDQRWLEEMKSVGDVAPNDLGRVVDDALRQHFFHLRQQKIDRERRFYTENHAALADQYMGQYIAIHNGEVIGTDQDGRMLSQRIRCQFGRIPVAIIEVAETPEPPTFKVRRPRLSTPG